MITRHLTPDLELLLISAARSGSSLFWYQVLFPLLIFFCVRVKLLSFTSSYLDHSYLITKLKETNTGNKPLLDFSCVYELLFIDIEIMENKINGQFSVIMCYQILFW